MKRLTFTALFIIFLFTGHFQAKAETRLALVIGNGDYQSSPLDNPVNDARLIAETLSNLNFNVIQREDLNYQEMNAVIDSFGRQLKDIEIALFYFAGHGMQINGNNYLIPVNSNIDSESEVKYRAVNAGLVLAQMKEAKTNTNIMILDACRNNPFKRSFRSKKSGLAFMDAPSGSIIAYATSPGKVALDVGKSKNHGLYSFELAKHLKIPGMRIEDVFINVRKNVKKFTKKFTSEPQVPWESTSLETTRLILASGYVIKEKGETKLLITSNISRSVVYINGQRMGYAPVNITQSGEYKIVVSKSGYYDFKKNVRLSKNMSLKVGAVLDKIITTGNLKLKGSPKGAEVYISDILSGSIPCTIRDLEQGYYELKIQKEGYKTGYVEIRINAGETTDKSVKLKSKGPVVGQKWRESLTGMEFVYIQPGTFMMGSPSDEPERDNDETQHKVTISRGFYMQTTEVTQGQWKKIMGSNPSGFKNCGDNCPVEQVSWNDTQEFIKKLNRRTGKTYRLPTEAEWEYACRAGTTTPFYFGETISTDQANYDGNCIYGSGKKGIYRERTIAVGSFPPNSFGIYDMHGNIYEWCQDIYSSDAYSKHQRYDPIYADSGSNRVIRGGSWYSDPRNVRCADRRYNSPGHRNYGLGFRLVRTP
ncbi:formylglycine-generating enzyme [Candidatus Magnetomoraceae bacterium gMMP-1]